MAHPEMEAAGSPAPVSVAEKAADFENYLFGEIEDEALDETEEVVEAEADDELDTEEVEEDEADEEADEDDEPDAPAIEAPVSLNAEEKEVFAQLPPEAQQAWAASETRRNQQVQQATTEAREAQRVADAAAASADRQAEARFGKQLQEFAGHFEPQMPDPAHYSDMETYRRDSEYYKYAKAQFDQLKQQVDTVGVETAEQKAERIQKRDAELMKIPEVADEATRETYLRSAFEVAGELGYDQAALQETMDATDLRAFAQAAKWKADSAELARIKAKSKERRRDTDTGQFRSMKPGAAPQSKGRAAKSKKSWDRVKANKGNRQAFGEASAEWLEASGHL